MREVFILETHESEAIVVNPMVLLPSQLFFNFGIYKGLPFLAFHLPGNLALAGAAILLGTCDRTFSQYGAFILVGTFPAVSATSLRVLLWRPSLSSFSNTLYQQETVQ